MGFSILVCPFPGGYRFKHGLSWMPFSVPYFCLCGRTSWFYLVETHVQTSQGPEDNTVSNINEAYTYTHT